jgi:hypothetical protein
LEWSAHEADCGLVDRECGEVVVDRLQEIEGWRLEVAEVDERVVPGEKVSDI